MIKSFIALIALGVALFGAQPHHPSNPARVSDLDTYWSELAQTVADGNYDGYAASYHEDAVLVNGLSQTSYPIAQALNEWKQGFEDTKAGKVKAFVEFRFSQRLADPSTAHETGIFHYVAEAADGTRSESYIHFEGLLVNKDGWKMMMEYQKTVASLAEWDALK